MHFTNTFIDFMALCVGPFIPLLSPRVFPPSPRVPPYYAKARETRLIYDETPLGAQTQFEIESRLGLRVLTLVIFKDRMRIS